ncbi:MAG: hypothetical protein KGH72_01820 [Candidatus Micrarchaeota archaeon]|nr:hypothetical protein [Candidatus Micrarchaeota archaeon]
MRLAVLAAVLFGLLFLSSPAFAISLPDCQPLSTITAGTLPDIPLVGIGVAALALTISFDVIAIGYMISRIFPHLGLRQWLQNEYWELAKSILLIVGIYGSMLFVSNIAYLLQSNPTPEPGASQLTQYLGGLLFTSEGYLGGVCSYLFGTWTLVGDMFLGIGFMKSLVVGYFVPLPVYIGAFTFGVQFGPYQNLMLDTGNFIVAFYQSILNDFIQFLLFPVTMMTLAQLLLLPSLMAVGLSFFIPLGLVFRAFPFVRGVGGTLIAIGVAFALIYPAVLSLLDYPIITLMQQDIPLPEWTLGHSPGLTICSGNFLCGFLNNQIKDLFALIPNNGMAVYFAWETLFGTLSTYINYMLNYGVFIIMQLLLYVLDLLIIWSITDSLAKSLGGSIRLQLGGKLKLAT